jgi:tetratricopeptide (TPR) repeat protein
VNHRLVALILAGLASTAFAQPGNPSPADPVKPAQPIAAPTPEVAAQPDREPVEAFARELARMTLLDLRAIRSPALADYRAALTLLAFAHELDPANTDIIRRQIEAAHSAGDEDAVLEHTRALLLKDPTDSVAILRLISSTILRRSQDAESRLAEYEAYLSGDKRNLVDDSIRSRLALDAALLHRERGDDRAFKDKLVQSMQLDSTHKEAAVLAATFFAERVDTDPTGRLDLLVNVLKADPVDPNIHLSIARELVVGGAYTAALRFHNNAYNISSTISPPGDSAVVENRVLIWYARGPAMLIKSLNDSVAAERDAAARAIRHAVDQKKPTDNLPKPDEVQLPAPVMVLYILAADAVGDTAAATASVHEFTRQAEKLIEKLRNPRTRGETTEAAANGLILEATIQLNTLRLWTGIDAEKYNQSPELLRAIRQSFPEAADFLDALWALRNDRPQETIELCTPTQDQRMSQIAMGMAYERLGDRDKAIDRYKTVFQNEPLQPAGAWARQRLVTLGADPTPRNAKSIAALVADPRVPAWIDQLAIDPGSFIRVAVSLPAGEADAASYVPIRLHITNQSPIPLALGPDRPINSRFLVAPKLERGDLQRFGQPEVIDIDRRFRLLPRQSIDVDIWHSSGQAGWTLDSLANRSVRLRWKLIQGFVADSKGTYHAGPMCLEPETNALLVRPLAATALSPVDLARSIQGSPLENLRRLACVARAQIMQPILLPDPIPAPDPKDPKPQVIPPPAAPVDFKPVAHAFSTRYPTLPPNTRAMIAMTVPHARLSPDMAALDAVVLSDQHPLVRCVALCTRVSDPADPALAAAKSADDPRIVAVATAVESRLRQPGARFYATLTPADLRPPPAAGAAGVEGGGGAPR